MIPRKDRPCRSSGLMRYDPYTLLVTLTSEGTANGNLYIDDGESYDYQEGAFIHRNFISALYRLDSLDFEDEKQRNQGKKRREFVKLMDRVRVEKIIVVGAPGSWQGWEEIRFVEDGEARAVEMGFEWGGAGTAKVAVVGDPRVRMGRD